MTFRFLTVSTLYSSLVQESASGSFIVQIPDVWINLAHVQFALGNFALLVKMYQNCLRKFHYNTDSQALTMKLNNGKTVKGHFLELSTLFLQTIHCDLMQELHYNSSWRVRLHAKRT